MVYRMKDIFVLYVHIYEVVVIILNIQHYGSFYRGKIGKILAYFMKWAIS